MTHTAPDLYFDLNSHVLSAHQRQELVPIAPALRDLLRDCPELIVVAEGHSDDRGPVEYNDRLALERAEAVRRALVNLGVPGGHLQTISLGCRAPQCLTQDDPCRQKNRRVHFEAAQTLRDTGAGK